MKYVATYHWLPTLTSKSTGCGRVYAPLMNPMYGTTDTARVTCRNCRRSIQRAAKAAKVSA